MVATKSRTRSSTGARAATPIGSSSSQVSVPAQVAVTAQQSSDVIQIFLYSAVSTILWMRDLLPDEYFRTAFFATINKPCSYRDFTHGSDDGGTVQGERSRSKGYHLRVLKQNVSFRGAQITQWLESAIFESIKLGYLDQVQFTIFAHEHQPTEVLEIYCFHFQYSESSQDGGVAVDLEIKDIQNKKTSSLKNTRQALNTVIKSMVTLNGTMPHLPERCFLSPYLIWNERRPSGYQPPGFNSSDDLNVSFPDTEGWKTESSMCGQVKTHFQEVGFGIAYTKGIAFHDYGEAIVMPEFSYGKSFSRIEPLFPLNDMISHARKIVESRSSAFLSPRPDPVAGDGDVANCSPIITHTDEKHAARHENIDFATDTQDKEDILRLRALQPIEQKQTYDTQLIQRPSLFPSQTISSANAFQDPHTIVDPTYTKNLPLTKSSEISTISCECGTKETTNIIQCHTCNSWQHAQCYAYEGPDDTRLAAEHNCYTCLSGNTASKQLDEVIELTRARQLIHCVQMRGLTSPADIAKILGYKRAEVESLLKALQQSNIIIAKNIHKKFAHISLDSTQASKRALLEHYLNPVRTIEKLVQGVPRAATDSTTTSITATGRVTRGSTASRKRKDHGGHDGEMSPKTPRISRPSLSLAFDSNAPYTPDGGYVAGQALD